jgi:hypothetical protein
MPFWELTKLQIVFLEDSKEGNYLLMKWFLFTAAEIVINIAGNSKV